MFFCHAREKRKVNLDYMKENETGKTQLLIIVLNVRFDYRNLFETIIIEIWIHAYGCTYLKQGK